MVSSAASTVEEYLSELPDDRRSALEAIRAVIVANLPDGYVETMNWGMISYEVPLETFPDTYNGKPLMYAALASQKRHMAVYLSAIYSDPELYDWFVSEYESTGKRTDIGKSCVRFTTLEHLPLDLLGEAIAKIEVDEFLEIHHRTGSR